MLCLEANQNLLFYFNNVSFSTCSLLFFSIIFCFVLGDLQIRPLKHCAAEAFENRSFAPKVHQMLCVHTTLDEFKNPSLTGLCKFVFEENFVREIT